MGSCSGTPGAQPSALRDEGQGGGMPIPVAGSRRWVAGTSAILSLSSN